MVDLNQLEALLVKATTDNPWGGPFDKQDARNEIIRALPSLIARIRDLERIEAGVAGLCQVCCGAKPGHHYSSCNRLPAPPADGEAREALTGGKDG